MSIPAPTEITEGKSVPSFRPFSPHLLKEKATFPSSLSAAYDFVWPNGDDIRWCWKESSGTVDIHPWTQMADPDCFVDHNDEEPCFTMYPDLISHQIETTWSVGRTEYHIPGSRRRIDFEFMKEVDEETGSCWTIKRINKETNEEDMGGLPIFDGIGRYVFGEMEFTDPKDIPAYTCACRERCNQVLQNESLSDTTTATTTEDSVDLEVSDDCPCDGGETNHTKSEHKLLVATAACNRRHFCTSCLLYAHECCLTDHLCQKCYDVKLKSSQRPQSWWGCLLEVILCPLSFAVLCLQSAGLFGGLFLYLFLLFFICPPFGIHHALFFLPEDRKINIEYLEDGIEIDGLVTRRWTYEANDGDGGRRTVHQCSIAYCFPKDRSIYRMDLPRAGVPTDKWRGMYEGRKVKLVALEGCPKSARIHGNTFTPSTPAALMVTQICLITFSLGCTLVFPVLILVWSQPGGHSHPYIETNRWVSILMYCILGSHLVMTLYLCLRPFFDQEGHVKELQEFRTRSTIICTSKAGDLSSKETDRKASTASCLDQRFE